MANVQAFSYDDPTGTDGIMNSAIMDHTIHKLHSVYARVMLTFVNHRMEELGILVFFFKQATSSSLVDQPRSSLVAPSIPIHFLS